MYTRLVLNLLVLLLPTQLGLHFWPSFSRVVGIRVDYLSPTLYLTDLLLILYLGLNISKIFRFLKDHKKFLVISTCYMLFNSYFGLSPLNSIVWWTRISSCILFALTLRLNKINIKDISKSLSYSVILVIFIQILQFIKQGSINGFFYYLGERHFTYNTANLARITLFNQEYLRVPSLFPHPNSLAGYLLLTLFVIPSTRLKVLSIFSLFLTFSKSAILGLITSLVSSKYFKKIIHLCLITSLLLVVIVPENLSKYSYQIPYFLSSRYTLVIQAKQIIKEYLFFGTGLGNFIPALSKNLPGSHLTLEYLQPVHNTVILLVSELGILFFSLLAYQLSIFVNTIQSKSLLVILTIVILTGLFDHYWLTIHQNRLLLSLLFGILI